jgi:hypothetical protein
MGKYVPSILSRNVTKLGDEAFENWKALEVFFGGN